jgi:serine acetyltransferase
MKRDFSNESNINVLLRAKRAIQLRFRGWLYSFIGVFNVNSSHQITIGKNPRILNGKAILLHKDVAFSDFCRLEAYQSEFKNQVKIEIGSDSSFGEFLHIGAINSIKIGKNVLGGSKILIIDHDHGYAGKHLKEYGDVPPRERELISKGAIIIEDNVWIAEGVIILAGSKIGKGSIIAANSVVKGEVQPYSVYINGK